MSELSFRASRVSEELIRLDCGCGTPMHQQTIIIERLGEDQLLLTFTQESAWFHARGINPFYSRWADWKNRLLLIWKIIRGESFDLEADFILNGEQQVQSYLAAIQELVSQHKNGNEN